MYRYLVIFLLLLVSVNPIFLGPKNKNTSATSAKQPTVKPQVKNEVSDIDNKEEKESSKQSLSQKQKSKAAKQTKNQVKKKAGSQPEQSSSPKDNNKDQKNDKKISNQGSKATSLTSKTKGLSKKTNKNSKNSQKNAKQNEVTDTKTVKTIQANLNANGQQDKRSFIVVFFVYFIIFSAICYGFKYVYYPNESIFLMLLDLAMMAQSIAKSKSRGYKAPQYTEQAEDYNSITIGYDEQQGRQLFWEKNSVEGI